MLRIPDVKILRVYGDRKEEAVFPIPNKRKSLKLSADDEFEIKDDGLRAVSLHHVIRGQECPYASDLRDYDRKFEEDRKKGVRTEDSEVESYRTVRPSLNPYCFTKITNAGDCPLNSFNK